MNLKKLERYLRVTLLGPGPSLIKKEFTGPRSHKGWETLVYRIPNHPSISKREYCIKLLNELEAFGPENNSRMGINGIKVGFYSDILSQNIIRIFKARKGEGVGRNIWHIWGRGATRKLNFCPEVWKKQPRQARAYGVYTVDWKHSSVSGSYEQYNDLLDLKKLESFLNSWVSDSFLRTLLYRGNGKRDSG